MAMLALPRHDTARQRVEQMSDLVFMETVSFEIWPPQQNLWVVFGSGGPNGRMSSGDSRFWPWRSFRRRNLEAVGFRDPVH